MANTVTGLIFRLVKGSPLSPVEGDNNLSILANFSNTLAASLGIALNPDGSLANGALSKPAQIGNAALMADFLAASESCPLAVTVGTVYTVTNAAINNLTAGLRVKFLADLPNAGAWSVTVTGSAGALPNTPILRQAGVPIVQGDILAGDLVELIYDGANFQLPTRSLNVATVADVTAATSTTKAVTPASLKGFVPNGLAGLVAVVAPATLAQGTFAFAHTLGRVPGVARCVFLCTDAGGDAGYAKNYELDSAGVQFNSGGDTGTQPAVLMGADATNVNVTLLLSGGLSPALTLTKWKLKVYAG